MIEVGILSMLSKKSIYNELSPMTNGKIGNWSKKIRVMMMVIIRKITKQCKQYKTEFQRSERSIMMLWSKLVLCRNHRLKARGRIEISQMILYRLLCSMIRACNDSLRAISTFYQHKSCNRQYHLRRLWVESTAVSRILYLYEYHRIMKTFLQNCTKTLLNWDL